MEKEVIELSMSDIFSVASGSEDDMGVSIGSIRIDKIKNNDIDTTINELFMRDAVIYITGNENTSVVEVEYPIDNRFEYEQHTEMATNYLKEIDNPEYDDLMLSVIIIPLKLNGQIMIWLNRLIYITGIEFQDKFKIIMAFDNTTTQYLADSEADYQAMLAQLDAEYDLMEADLDRQIDEAEDQGDEFYQSLIKEATDTESITQNRFRSVKEEDDEE